MGLKSTRIDGLDRARLPMAASRGSAVVVQRRARLSRASESVVWQAVWGALAVISALSVANFNEGIVPANLGSLQQVVVLGLWVLVVGATFRLRPVLLIGEGTEFYAIVAFYAFAALSVAWSGYSPDTILKGISLTVTTFGAYRVATHIELDDFLDAISAGFVIICGASVALVFVVPQIGVDQTWMHQGQWQGVFQSKQSLGTVGAFLMFFAYHRLLNRGGWPRFLAVFGLAAVCVIGSESRGGAAVALAACLSLSLPKHWRGVTKVLAFGPVLMIGVALVAITYLIASGTPYIPLFGIEVDFTERAIIWQYALSHFSDHPLLGFGLNGFWSIDEMFHGFEREHGWVLDNYHDGYIGIVVETGIAGMALFTAGIVLFGLKMAWMIDRRGMARTDYTVIVGFVNLIFFIDMTETFFLRSTNINSILLITLLFKTCQGPGRRQAPGSKAGGGPA